MAVLRPSKPSFECKLTLCSAVPLCKLTRFMAVCKKLPYLPIKFIVPKVQVTYFGTFS